MGGRTIIVSIVAVALAAAGCSSDASEPLPPPPAGIASITVTAEKLTNGLLMRPRYTCDSVNLSPGIWSGTSDDTVTTVIIVDDPDAPGGSFSHWTVYDIPANVTSVVEGDGAPFDTRRSGGLQGITGFGDLGYSGPARPKASCTPTSSTSTRASREVDLPARAERNDVIAAMERALIGHGVLLAPYQRQERSDENVVFKTPTPEDT